MQFLFFLTLFILVSPSSYSLERNASLQQSVSKLSVSKESVSKESVSKTTTVQRVISLAPSSTELVYAAGLGDKLVAVSDYSDYPEEAKALESVASYNSVNVERIVALNPDLIVAWRSGASMKSLNQLERFGFTIYYSDATHLADIATRIEELSQYADDPSFGLANARHFMTELNQLSERYTNKKPLTYFYQLSEDPIFTIAQDSWPTEVFTLCGGINIFAQSPSPYPQVGLEQIIVKAPDIIFSSPHTIEHSQMWQTWVDQIPALRNHFIWSLNSNWLNRPTPRSLKAVQQVCHYFEQARSTPSIAK